MFFFFSRRSRHTRCALVTGVQTCALPICFMPYSHETRRVTEAARKIGCKVVAITDSVVAPIAQHADCTLIISTETPSFFPSVTSIVALVELLVEQLLIKEGMQAVSGIEFAEAQLHQTGAYIPPK